jgi:AraC-like DNA-binding protein
VLYLDDSVLGPDLIGRSVDRPTLVDGTLRRGIERLHEAPAGPGEELAGAERLALVGDRLRRHLTGTPPDAPSPAPRAEVADRLRQLLDARVVPGITLQEAADEIGAHPTHLVRSFTHAYGLPPHRYLTGRRVDLARRLVLDGVPLARVAVETGFHDQAHLTRHFRRLLGTSPGRFAGRR